MKLSLTILCLFLCDILQGQTLFDRADAFFSAYVEKGLVDYGKIKQEPKLLNELVREIAELDLSNRRVTPEYLKAFYINAYNVLVIKQVVDQYPIEGPLKVDGFFDAITHEVMGEEVTLDELEKEILFAQFPDPRLHFVLVCAAKGCPPLASFAFEPTNLDRQLEERTRYVLNLDWFIRVNKEENMEISQLFEWYRVDFTKTYNSVISYINQYRDIKVDQDRPFDYYEYDWTLNELK